MVFWRKKERRKEGGGGGGGGEREKNEKNEKNEKVFFLFSTNKHPPQVSLTALWNSESTTLLTLWRVWRDAS